MGYLREGLSSGALAADMIRVIDREKKRLPTEDIMRMEAVHYLEHGVMPSELRIDRPAEVALDRQFSNRADGVMRRGLHRWVPATYARISWDQPRFEVA